MQLLGGVRHATCWALRAKRWLSRRGQAVGPSEEAWTTTKLGEEPGLDTKRMVGSAEPGGSMAKTLEGGLTVERPGLEMSHNLN